MRSGGHRQTRVHVRLGKHPPSSVGGHRGIRRALISEIVMRANVGYGKAQCGLPGRSELRQIVLETREGWQHRALAAYIRSSTELKFSDWKARKCFAGSY